MDINKIHKPFWLTQQYPLDIRLWVAREEDLKDLGYRNHKAYTYYSGMIVVAADTGRMYIWKEFDPDRENGLLKDGFRYPDNYKFGGIDYSNKLYNFVEFPFGLEFHLSGAATVWNDQLTNYIKGEGTTEYTLAEQVFEQTVPYAVYKNKVWVKLNIEAGKSVTVKFYPDQDSFAENEKVFFLYDDFNSYNTSIWNYQNSILISGTLSVKGGNQIVGATTSIKIPNGSIIEWNMYSKAYDFDSGIRVGNIWFISDRGTGSQSICTGWCYPSGSQQANTWNEYRVILRSGNLKFTNVTLNRTVTSSLSYTQGGLSFVCDSDTSSNPLDVDFICVRKYYDENNIDIYITNEPDGSITAIVTNTGTEDILDTEIAIKGINPDYYKVKVINSTPTLACNAFPPDVVSSVKFFTQFDHLAKYGSKCAFHVHSYIPPTASPGTVKFRLTWQVIPVEIVLSDNETLTISTANKITKTIEKKFDITEEMLGRHVLLNFGRIDTVNSISQVVFHKLERLGDDPEDTFISELPYLYMDWHTEYDTLGSQDEFVKY